MLWIGTNLTAKVVIKALITLCPNPIIRLVLRDEGLKRPTAITRRDVIIRQGA
jgi:hypothetical protein